MYTDLPPAIVPALIILVLFVMTVLFTFTKAIIEANQNKPAYRRNRRTNRRNRR